MKVNSIPSDYKGFRFPSEIISHAVWLYFRFSLSFRDVEELLAQRGIIVTYETIRQWCLKFGQTYANEVRRRRLRWQRRSAAKFPQQRSRGQNHGPLPQEWLPVARWLVAHGLVLLQSNVPDHCSFEVILRHHNTERDQPRSCQ
jgi:hypothetical protein